MLFISGFVVLLIEPTSVIQLVAAGALVVSGVFNVLLRTSFTYVLFNEKTGQVYIGRTSGFGKPINVLKRRMYAHPYKILGFGNPMIDKAMQGIKGYRAIRGREQQLIDSYGGIGSVTVANKIRAVAKRRNNAKFLHNQSNKYFGKLHHYTGISKT